ncbi:uncharacterized protein lcorl isoform X2 [Haplochromis burtoni]|uniref:uncharacterized protein lcorl isoform X2 n=1 Tax=Haplochromis burtoni TaxID=8153 RepID=UPI001C2D522F|nr:uncharacterized protein lcorl isoform X2 [Haplochromis burtoni]
MTTLQCRCMAEKKLFRRELDSWRYKLIHCVGFESILEGIYGPLPRDLNLFHDCEPEEVDDWSPESNCSPCSFCNVLLDKSSDQAPAATSPLSSPSDYSPCQAPTISESTQSAHKFLQAVFHKKDVHLSSDSNIPQIAQELMKKMITTFAKEYASKCLLHTNTNGVTRTSSPLSDASEASDAPLDLTVNRTPEENTIEDGVLDLSNRNSACSTTSSSSENHRGSGSLVPSFTEDKAGQQQRGTKFGQCSTLDDVLSSLCPAHQSLIYQILKYACHEKEMLRNERDTVLCSKKLHCTSCQSLVAASPASCHSPCTPSSNLCSSSSICCEKRSFQIKKTTDGEVGDGDPPCPVLKREQSPSPPPLSPIPSDFGKKCDENPPSLLHQEEDVNLMVQSFVTASYEASDVNATTEDAESKIAERSQADKNPSGTSLQDVMDRFSEKLETITPLDKDPTLVSTAIYVSEKEQPLSPSTSYNLPFRADAHVTEIITTVLRTSSPSDYSLSELFSRQDKESKSPVTRSRHRQNVEKPKCTPEIQNNNDQQSSSVQKQVNTVATSSAKQCVLSCKEGGEGCSSTNDKSHKGSPSSETTEAERSGKRKACAIKGRVCHLLNISEGARRSRRNIVPPPRFSSYVTEPRRMFFVACFSEPIFNQKAQKDKASSSTNHMSSKDPDAKDANVESRNDVSLSSCVNTGKLAFQSAEKGHELSHMEVKSQSQVTPQIVTAKDQSPKKHRSGKENNSSDSVVPLLGRLRSASSKRVQDSSNMDVPINSDTCLESLKNSQVQYTSPIKLMFVSPVKDKEGVKYSLKSAGSGSGSQTEHFDPCEESSWSGTLQKHTIQSKKPAISQVKSVVSPLKSSASCIRSSCSPTKSSSSPAKSVSSTRRSGSSTPKCDLSPAKSGSSTPKSLYSPYKSDSSVSKSSSSPSKSASLTRRSANSPSKSGSSTPKCALSPAKSGSSTPKYGSSPRKSPSLPRSPSSSPKDASRGSGEGTPTKRVAGADSQGLSGNSTSFHETTPPKRRPGRPKKLGPQLEQKAKRPIGRPRKQKTLDSEPKNVKMVNGKCQLAPNIEENTTKNLKITVVYGRSRRNKRLVSEGFDQLQTEFHDAWRAVNLLHNSKTSSGSIKTTSEELDFVRPAKRPAPQSGSNIKCQKHDDSVRSRKPGRPAKVKISGISVTVTTVSPRQRKIQINKENRQSPEMLAPRKVLLQDFMSAKEPRTISHQLMSKRGQKEEGKETDDGSKDELSNQPVVRHSKRVRKPSIHFLHAVATSTSYSRSNALVRRSKQLLLNKANSERRQDEQQSSFETSGEKRKSCGPQKKGVSLDVSRLAGVSVDSIFRSKETLRWWAASAEEKTMNQELARRIRVISDTWVSDAVDNQEKELALDSKLGTKDSSLFAKNSNHSSVVRTLFDCSPNKPRSCSMQQICSWFMETTETQSLAIVKKASSRNCYELMHFPRSANAKSVCHSPQAERLRKHIKKFAKMVPKSPLQHQKAQRRLRKRNKAAVSTHRRQLFTLSIASKRTRQVQPLRGKAFSIYQATLVRARTRFLTRKERDRWQNGARDRRNIKAVSCCRNERIVTGLQSKRKALYTSTNDRHSVGLENGSAASSVSQTRELVDVHKEQNLCSKAWGPETLKECRVFLRKINSPDSESAEEEWDSCTVTLEGSPSAYLFAEQDRQLVRFVKAVKTERKRSINRTASKELADSASKSVQEQEAKPAGRQKRKFKSPRVASTEPPQPPPAKILRQSRMRGLTGPRWRDFVLES